jgi:ABC-type bacteriocin/lantibiotic exporter with double-glycine peptidase domain
MLSYSQRDPRWSQKKLGQSSLTMGRFGCTTTCIADLSTYFGDNLNPGQMVDRIKYTSGGLVIWQSCVFKNYSFWFRELRRNDTNIHNALIDPDLAVILQVNKGAHWVVATGQEIATKIFKIADPWFGDRSTMRRYKDSITGAAYFKRK